jgi:hypothetical protein
MSETQNTKVGFEQGGDTLFVKEGGKLKVGETEYTLPAVDGAAGQALVTDGSGTLSWAYVEGIAETPGG